MKVYMKVSDSEGNDQTLEIISEEGISEVERLTILSQIFNTLNIDSDFKNMVNDYIEIGNAYKKFHEVIGKTEEEIWQKEPQDLMVKRNKEGEEEQSHYKTGIVKENGVNKYKCRLHCSCRNNQNLYIKEIDKYAHCPSCGRGYEVRNAKAEGFPERDSWGNFFIAGNFLGEDEQ